MAVNCFVVPMAIVELTGVTKIETKVAPVTVSVAVPDTEPEVAVMVAVPAPTPVTMPEAEMLATLEDEADQFTLFNNCVLPSSKLPTALN